MPLQPNLIERQLIKRGTVSGLLLDVGVAGFQQGALIAAMELGLFDHLQDGSFTVEELADRTDASREGMEILLGTLVPLGYVSEHDGSYRLTDAARRSLPDRDLQLMSLFFKEQIRTTLDAAEAVREAPEDGIYGWERVKTGDTGRAYQAAMRWLASDLVDHVVDAVALPAGARRLLDVGGSHGLYTVRFCERYPGLEGTVLDWEIGLDSARRTLDESPHVADRIDLIERDFERDDLPGGYDVAFLGNIVHGLSPAGNRELFGKLAGATTDRGTVAILDQVADPPTSGPLSFDPFQSSFVDGVAALLGFNLFLFSGGRSYRYDDLERWLSDVGFSDVSYTRIRQSPGFSLVVARNPDAR